MQHFVYSEAGHDHINEDCAHAQSHPYGKDALICVLADGQGDQFGGGAAARGAVQKCLELAFARASTELWQERTWVEIVRAADVAVEADSDAGFTTLIALCATDAQVCGASCGDGATWLVEADGAAELTAAQRKNPPAGSGGARPIAFAASRSADTTLLLNVRWRLEIGRFRAHRAGRAPISWGRSHRAPERVAIGRQWRQTAR